MKDYVFPKTKSGKGFPWYYTAVNYQMPLDNQIDSLINYQSVQYPFFTLVNQTTQQDINYFQKLFKDQINFEPTNKNDLFTKGYAVKLFVNNVEKGILIFVNQLDKHQGFVVYDENYILCFVSKVIFKSTYTVTETVDQGIVQYNISSDDWKKLIYRPSTIDYGIFLRAMSLNNVVKTGSEQSGFATYKNEPSTYDDPNPDLPPKDRAPSNIMEYFIAWTQSGHPEVLNRDPNLLEENGMFNLLTSLLSFRTYTAAKTPLFANSDTPGVIKFIEKGTIFYSNTYYHNINHSLAQTLLFHISDFGGCVWTYSDKTFFLQGKEYISKTYGYNIVLPVRSRDLRFYTTSIIDMSLGNDVGVTLYTQRVSQGQKYPWIGEPVIVEQNTNFLEPVIADYNYKQIVSKIDNKTEYYYTIINKNEKTDAQLIITSI